MNAHLYFDGGEPVFSLVSETLSDGSKGWNLVTRERELSCRTERDGLALLEELQGAFRRHLCEECIIL